MTAHTREFAIDTRGNCHVLDITSQVRGCIVDTPVQSGIATLFVVGSTAGITTTEFEPGLVNRDLAAAFEGIAPENGDYLHEQTWHDDNGHSHVRASLLGPSLTVPVIDGDMPLGTWQQIILIDFDTRPRQRRVIVQVLS